MKKLVAIAIAVVAAIALFVYFGRSNELALAPMSQAQESPTPAAAEPRYEGAPHASSDTARPAPASSTLTDKQKVAACNAIMMRRAERGKAMLAAEPKDPAWAYPMEQKLREFTSRRFQSSEIDVVMIDCRTYYCDIKAQSFDPEKTQKDFQEGIGAIRQESWSGEFTGQSTFYEEEADKTFHVARMSRPWPQEMTRAFMRENPGEAQLLSDCAALQEKEQQQRRATRDAQDRDASWADPMEYQLRQYVTAQLAKHPVDHLDIDCRTTFCRLQASGRTDESETAFRKAAEDASKEPWANLWYAEVSGEGQEGVWDLSVVLYRRDQRL